VIVSELSGDASAGSAVQESDLDEERLVDFFDGVRFFSKNGAERVEADGASLIFLDDGEEELAIDFVEAVAIDLEHAEGGLRGGEIDGSGGANLSVVANAAKKAVGDAGSAAGAARDFKRSRGIDFDPENFGGAFDDDAEIIGSVELEAEKKAKARAERGGEQAGAGGGPDEGERFDIHGVGAGGGSLADDDVELVVFKRRVEELFERGLKAMDLVDEQDLAVAQIREDGGEVSFDLERRTGGLLEGDGKFVGDDVGEGSFAQAGRAVQEDVVESFSAGTSGLDGDVKVLFHLGLADEFDEPLRAEFELERGIVFEASGGDETVAFRQIGFRQVAGERIRMIASEGHWGDGSRKADVRCQVPGFRKKSVKFFFRGTRTSC
jgi:hypothetical protein